MLTNIHLIMKICCTDQILYSVCMTTDVTQILFILIAVGNRTELTKRKHWFEKWQ